MTHPHTALVYGPAHLGTSESLDATSWLLRPGKLRSMCAGPVTKCRLLFDYHRSTSIAFVEFAKYESAKNALDCSGALMGTMPIRVTPSKAPVRDDA